MKHTIAVKFLVFLLTALCLVSASAGAVGIVSIENAGLYVNRLDELQGHAYHNIGHTIGNSYINLYSVNKNGSIPYRLKQSRYPDPKQRSDTQYWYVRLYEGEVLISEFGAQEALYSPANVQSFTMIPQYPIASKKSPDENNELPPNEDDLPEGPEVNPNIEVPDIFVPNNYLSYQVETEWDGVLPSNYYLYYYEDTEYTVEIFMQEKMLESTSFHVLTSLYPFRYTCIAVLILCMILFFAGLVFLFWSAGINREGKLQLGGLNQLPLDLYLLMAVVCEFFLYGVFSRLIKWITDEGPHWGNLSLAIAGLIVMALPGIGWLVALAAQVKMHNFYCWRHSAVYWSINYLLRGIKKAVHWIKRGIGALFSVISVVGQWILIAFILSAVTILACIGMVTNFCGLRVLMLILFILCCISCLLVVIYGGYCFTVILTGAKRMSNGDLEYKIPIRSLRGSFRTCAEQMNALSEATNDAISRQVHAEWMKTELITNVSHDIKTPLTSIINFVDLLGKARTEEDTKQYLEVLSRQSQQLKKLITDLLDLSKASTGNMKADITVFNAAEAINQALGEFSDKLESVSLIPVFRIPDVPVMIAADGRLTWRVLSNLLSNAVKYATPGTRVYIDLDQKEDQVLLSIKNISREELRHSADELMERFVRGDASRNREGTGLGLNIAKSLMEVQHGSLELTLDGDLFKVTLTFPASQP